MNRTVHTLLVPMVFFGTAACAIPTAVIDVAAVRPCDSRIFGYRDAAHYLNATASDWAIVAAPEIGMLATRGKGPFWTRLAW